MSEKVCRCLRMYEDVWGCLRMSENIQMLSMLLLCYYYLGKSKLSRDRLKRYKINRNLDKIFRPSAVSCLLSFDLQISLIYINLYLVYTMAVRAFVSRSVCHTLFILTHSMNWLQPFNVFSNNLLEEIIFYLLERYSFGGFEINFIVTEKLL